MFGRFSESAPRVTLRACLYNATSFTVDLNFTDERRSTKWHFTSWIGTGLNRTETVQILDGE